MKNTRDALGETSSWHLRLLFIIVAALSVVSVPTVSAEEDISTMVSPLAAPRAILPTAARTKRILFLRHGQAAHNPRAEAARSAGCTHERFLELMRQDDAFDAPLTALGETQATEGADRYRHVLRNVDLVVSSPLSRALRTADLTVSPSSEDGEGSIGHPSRVCVEDFREINGWLVNAKRRDRSDLEGQFHPSWDFSDLTESDETWTETLETEAGAAERGYRGLLWLSKRKEERILVVCHGGILRFLMNQHPNVKLEDERTCSSVDDRGVGGRFGNCELREFVVRWTPSDETSVADSHEVGKKMELGVSKRHVHSMTGEVNNPMHFGHRPLVTMTEVSFQNNL
uniref:Phosphoglycerate mutase (2,3-diphosphoglycerate-dependent) n=1 Tax=Odontella aurita TaxID=265563 RepID=A0A7S4MZW9_9STRA